MKYGFKKYVKTNIYDPGLNMGGKNPSGDEISLTNMYFTRNGKPWIGVCGEYHFVRDSRGNWYTELCKMKAGGIGIVSTYLFWIYHEEEEGLFDFTDDRDLRQFVCDAKRAGLEVILRIGPWAHGECRNGGFPDWLVKKCKNLRTNDPYYLEKSKIFYSKIYEQIEGLLYKDGGNIIGIQLDNELYSNREHLLTLKQYAVEVGFDVPLYTVTGWGGINGSQIPEDDAIPLFGGYPEAPWSNHTDKLAPSENYAFVMQRNDTAIGSDMAEKSGLTNIDFERYPYCTCELGGGNQVTHHRRPVIEPMDVYALSVVKLGCGNNLVGYYMYHGGTNKIGKLSTLNESKDTGYCNDYPILNYDFQSPLSQYGEIRNHYRLLNLLHMFVTDFGDILAPTQPVEAENTVLPDNLTDLRYSMRTDGEGGFVFVNNYVRREEMKEFKDVVFDTGFVEFPPVDVKKNSSFILPFNLKLEKSLLKFATAQLLCHDDNIYYFMQIDGISPQYKFDDSKTVYRPATGTDNSFWHNGICIVTLSLEEALYLRKIDDKIYFGNGYDVYIENNNICRSKEVEITGVRIEASPEKYTPEHIKQLKLNFDRDIKTYELFAAAEDGFVEINMEYDVGQIYSDGILVADNFYNGRPWRVPAKLIYKKKCFMVLSELGDDFYREA